jgi:hypothetical protein
MIIFRHIFILALSALAIVSCRAETESTINRDDDDHPATLAKEIENPELRKNINCLPLDSAFDNLPAEVLVGTDVDVIGSFNSAAFTPGTYYAENGGAELSVTVFETESGLVAQRDYLEPGSAKDAKIYTDLCKKEDALYGKYLRVKFVKDGLLWLELEPDNDFIPTDLWFHLERSN